MPPTDAVILENWIPFPDRVETRAGASDHVTGFASPVKGLHQWTGGGSSIAIFATTDTGVYNVTSAGAVGAAVAALTNGSTRSVNISTGGTNRLMIVNGTDSLTQYDGATWSTVATFGGLTSNTITGLEVYKQRLWFIEKNSLNLWYLPVNSVSGAATSYALGAIFRHGGALVAIATWSLDAGNGADDHLVVMTDQGEVAVFTGTDPASLTTWTLIGVFNVGPPVGKDALFKYGGEILVLTESGVFALAQALQAASINRTIGISYKIRQLFATLTSQYGSNTGWQMANIPEGPFLLVNVPGVPGGCQLVMHSQTQAWTKFVGWEANCWLRTNNGLYCGMADKVALTLTGTSDFGNNINSTLLGAFSDFGSMVNKRVTAIRPAFTARGGFSYSIGFPADFQLSGFPVNTIGVGTGTSSLWGTGTWGTSVWGGSVSSRQWRVVVNPTCYYKALYLQVSSKTTVVTYQASEILLAADGTF
jgi:hypothetical protein